MALDPFVTGSLISGGASLLGGLFGSSSADKATQAAIANNAANIALQKEFAQKGIRWKVKDAQSAGIHPLYALNAQTHPFQPQNVFTGGGGKSALGRGLAEAGQDIGRAVAAGGNQEQRALALENARLQNRHLEAQTALLTRENQVPPALPSASDHPFMAGQGTSRGQIIRPVEREAATQGQPHLRPGAATDVGFTKTPQGGLAFVPGSVKNDIEDMIIPEIDWALRNTVGPMFTRPGEMNKKHRRPSLANYPLPPGFDWRWDWKTRQYMPKKLRSMDIRRHHHDKSSGRRPRRPQYRPFGGTFTGS